MLAVLWFDTTKYIIPNWVVGLLLLVYPMAVATSQVNTNWTMSVLGALTVLVLGYVIFLRRLMGAGDIKLLTVCSLWVGLNGIVDFLVLVALGGGALAVVVLGIRKMMPFINKSKDTKIPRIFCDNEPVPYGIAIAFGFLYMMCAGQVPLLGLPSDVR